MTELYQRIVHHIATGDDDYRIARELRVPVGTVRAAIDDMGDRVFGDRVKGGISQRTLLPVLNLNYLNDLPELWEKLRGPRRRGNLRRIYRLHRESGPVW